MKPQTKPQTKPKIRILHCMARTGGTLFSRCLGSMHDVVLLSEIHPQGAHIYDPVRQASEWFGLRSAKDAKSFSASINEIHRQCEALGRSLVLRDWSHLDFTFSQFCEKPARRSLLSEALLPHFTVLEASIVRHPVEQWASLVHYLRLRGVKEPTLHEFLEGYRDFAEMSDRICHVRFEDFLKAPDTALREVCRGLELNFDPDYKKRWRSYRSVTGDLESLERDEFGAHSETRLPPELWNCFQGDQNFQQAISILGYGC